jgi:DNA-binding HxlR family transcriptional regulator
MHGNRLRLLHEKWTPFFGVAVAAVEGISQRMLTLKGLEEDGLVNRTMYPTIPPRVDYELTDLGRKLIVPLQSLYEWAVEHRPAMLAAREKFAKKQRKAALRQTSFTAAK